MLEFEIIAKSSTNRARAFSIFYFFVLIRIGRRTMAPRGPDPGRKAMLVLQSRLEPTARFFGGDVPNTVDLQLFGLVQMFSSIPVPERSVRWVRSGRSRSVSGATPTPIPSGLVT